MAAAPGAVSATDFSRGSSWPATARNAHDHKNAAQIAVTLFRDRPKLLFAPGRILSRYEPHPGGKITARPKGIRVGHRGGYGARANNADPGDALQSLARFIRTMLHNDPPLDRANHRLQRLELCG